MLISHERYAFLMYVLFGSEKNTYIASSKAAYRDLCRTLRLGATGGEQYRRHIDSILESRVVNILSHKNLTQSEYDSWHHSVCDMIIKYYTSNDITFTIGQAQKWLNMMMKYLYIRGDEGVEHTLSLMHVPIDQYIFRAVERELKIPRPCFAWSKLNNYNTYLAYQERIRTVLEIAPLLWEIEAWLGEASISE